jgi:hypothetical protein
VAAALSSLGDAAATQDSYSAAEREKQAWREDKARQREEMAHMERSVRLAEVRNRRLELDKEHLQRKMIDLMIDKRRLQQRLEEMEERASREEIRRHCVVCMDHARSHVLMPCRHYIVCQYCANNIRSATTRTLMPIAGSLSHSWGRVAYATCVRASGCAPCAGRRSQRSCKSSTFEPMHHRGRKSSTPTAAGWRSEDQGRTTQRLPA